MVEIKEYLDANGRSPFAKWFDGLNARAAGVGAGVFEYRLEFGPGYRIYFGKDGDMLIILLGGGTKKRQQKDIEAAKSLWKQYKQRKRQES